MLDLYEFEVAEAATDSGGGGGEAGAAPSSDAANPQGAEGEAGSPPPAAATDTAPAWSPTDPAFREAVATEAEALFAAFEERQRLYQQQTQQQPQQPVGAQAPDYDPFDPESVRAYMAWERQQTVNELRNELSPIRQTFEQREQAEYVAHLETVIDDIVADEVSRNGDITDGGKEMLQVLGVQFLPQFEARYGKGSPRSIEATVAHTANIIRGIEKAAAEKAIAEHVNRNAQLAGASGEPGTGAGSGVQAVGGVVPGPNFTSTLAQKYGQQADAIRRNF